MAIFNRKPSSAPAGASLPRERKSPSTLVLVPLVSEKSARLAHLGQYTFVVPPGTSKVEVKKAVEVSYGVRVVGVNSVRLPRKTLRRGRTIGHTRVRRHMVVRLAKGQTIDLAKF